MAVIRPVFEEELRDIQLQAMLLGQMVDEHIERGIDCLQRLDADAARQLIADDDKVDEKRWEIEDKVVQIIATQQPLAGDLRLLLAILHIVVDLERIGDYAEGIGKIVVLHDGRPLVKPLVDIPRMADCARSMLRRSLVAFSQRDVEAARSIADEDDVVDQLHDQVYHELLLYMLRDPSTIERATYLTWVSHNLERIADRATNICEQTVYLVTGHNQEINVSKY